jgi:hypothetical protein
LFRRILPPIRSAAPIGSVQDAANCAIELSRRSLKFVKIM